MRSLNLAASLALAPLAASPAAAQSTLQTLLPPDPPAAVDEAFGAAVTGLEDVDGDGVHDFAVASLRPNQSDPSVRVYSGADESILLSFDLGSIDGTGVDLDELYDVDGDGVSELLVGLPEAGGGDGLVFVFSLRTGEVLRTHTGSAGERLGASVAGLNDVLAGGVADYAVGAPKSGAHNHGAVYVFSGDTGALIDKQSGTNSAQGLGHDVASLGDFNHDNRVDVVASGLGNGIALGTVVVFTPSTSQVVLDFPATFDGWGTAVTGLGDVVGDSAADFAVSAPLVDVTSSGGGNLIDAGLIYVVAGGTAGGGYTMTGDFLERLGTDLDRTWAPGNANWMVAATGSAAKLIDASSGAELESWQPATPAIFEAGDFRLAIDGIGDLDGDGSPDVLIGAPRADEDGVDSGLATAHGGASGATLRKIAPRDGRRAGAAVALLGDANGDGRADTAIGIPHDDTVAYDGGAVILRSGADGSELWRVDGYSGAQLGATLARLDDLDGDGVAELAVGAPWALSGGLFDFRRSGHVRILSGATGQLLLTVDGDLAGERFGAALDAFPDQDGDGRSDLAVGAPEHHTGPVGHKRGRVAVCSTATGAQLTELLGPTTDGRFGRAVVGIDGGSTPFFDRIASVSTAFGTGRLDTHRIGDGLMIWSAAGGEQHGAALTAVPDRDGDGIDEVLVGDPGFDDGRGRAVLRRGGNGLFLEIFEGGVIGDRFGAALARVADTDLDGVDELAIGAPGRDDFGTFPPVGNAGRVQVFSGDVPYGLLRTFDGVSLGQELGGAVAAGGDVDGDGLPDLAVGSPGYLSDLGFASTVDLRAASTFHYGTGTPGCDNPHRLVASIPPAIGSALELRTDGAPAGTIVYLVLSLIPDVPGTDPGFGYLVHVAGAGQFFLTTTVSDSFGRAVFPQPVPDDPALVGLDVFAQTVVSNTPAPCPELPNFLSSSHGLWLRLTQ